MRHQTESQLAISLLVAREGEGRERDRGGGGTFVMQMLYCPEIAFSDLVVQCATHSSST